MTVDVRILCAVCAWRAACTKKFKSKQGALHCPDYSRDVTIPEGDVSEETKASALVEHKRVDDVFGDS